jgi:hypothetical protein
MASDNNNGPRIRTVKSRGKDRYMPVNGDGVHTYKTKQEAAEVSRRITAYTGKK